MDFRRLLAIAGDEPAFETGLLLAGDARRPDVERQLSRWTTAGRIVQLRRGVYALAEPYRKVRPHPFLLANRLVRGSYVSREAALAFYGLIPEHAPVTTSITTQRPQSHHTPLGAFDYRHLKPALFFGYARVPMGGGQHAFVAWPEKALLDLVHLTPGGEDPGYLSELRLQNLASLDLTRLHTLAGAAAKPKLLRAARAIARLAEAEAQEYETL
jgi:predicted transcriptional regulator of viral defense system